MNEIIYEYSLVTFGEDLTYLIEQTFKHFEEYGLDDYETEFFNIITDDTFTDPAGMQDNFYIRLVSYITFILQSHGIKLNDEATLREMNEILDAIKILQNLLDYEEVYDVIEMDIDEFTKFARIFELTSCLTESRIKDIVEDFDDDFIMSLKYLIKQTKKINESYIYNDSDTKTKIIANARKFNKFIKEAPTLGVQMLDQGLLIGEEFNLYIPYIEEHLITIKDVKALATNLYSVIILSSDGFANPLLCYKNNINKLSLSPETINNIEVAYNNFAAEYESYKRGTSSRLH